MPYRSLSTGWLPWSAPGGADTDAEFRIMSRFVLSTGRPVEYFILVEPHADGPVVGYYAGNPIPAAVVDYFGRRYSYAGVAPRRRGGQYDVEALGPGEWIVEPGLVYHDIASRH
jgi:hypothetical protein